MCKTVSKFEGGKSNKTTLNWEAWNSAPQQGGWAGNDKVKHACNTHCWGLYVNSQLTWRAGCSKEDVSCRCTHVLHREQQCPELCYEGVYCVPNRISVHFRVTIKILEMTWQKLQLGASEMESLVTCRGQPHCTETYLTELSLSIQCQQSEQLQLHCVVQQRMTSIYS